MSDYIKREDAIKAVAEYTKDCFGIFEDAILNAEDVVLGSVPSADVIEPKRGEWKPFDLKWGRSIWYCTACEDGVEVPCDIWTHKPIYNYCPNCGARMKGADDD